MVNPAALKADIGRHIGIVGIVAGNVGAVGLHPVAGIREVGVGALLGTVLGDGEAAQFGAVRAKFGDPADCRDSHHRRCPGGFGGRDKGIRTPAGSRIVVTDAFKEIIRGLVVGIKLPVVAGRVVAAHAIERDIEVCQRVGIPICNAVDQRADRMAIGGRIHGDDTGVHGRRHTGQGNIVHVVSRQRAAAGVLNPEAVQGGRAGDAEGGQRDAYLGPCAGLQRGQGVGRLGGAVECRLHLQGLAAACTAVDPEHQIAVGSAVEGRVVQVQRLVAAGVDGDRIGPAMHRAGTGKVDGGPAIVSPAVLQGVGINTLIGPRRQGSQQWSQQCAQGSHTERGKGASHKS